MPTHLEAQLRLSNITELWAATKHFSMRVLCFASLQRFDRIFRCFVLSLLTPPPQAGCIRWELMDTPDGENLGTPFLLACLSL